VSAVADGTRNPPDWLVCKKSKKREGGRESEGERERKREIYIERCREGVREREKSRDI
jgi:hypothetical protein